MLTLNVILVCCLALITVGSTLGAPHSSRKEQDLRKSFVEFLEQDKELSALLAKANLGDGPTLTRSVRQAEEEELSNEQDIETTEKKDGFFDRAAKFVMEVLQRFLKWVNSDN